MGWKDYISEGRNPWMLFTIKKGKDRWSFRNTQTNKLNYVKISPTNEIGSMQNFLKELIATPGALPKTHGKINYYEFAREVVAGNKHKVYIKSGKFNDIQKTWLLED